MSANNARDILLFSYGTLQQANVQQASFGRLLEGSPDAMPGYRSALVEITDADVLRTSGERFHPIVKYSGEATDEVAGHAYFVSAQELAAADRYEVADYARVEARLKSGRMAWVYVRATSAKSA